MTLKRPNRKPSFSALIAIICILKNHIVTAKKWSLKDFSNNGSDNEKEAHYDETSKTLHMPSFSAKNFRGNALNFQGADVANAHLVNTTIDGFIPHLAINTLEVRSEIASAADGIRMATFDLRGGLSTAKGVKWDDRKERLQVDQLSSCSSPSLSIHSSIDLNSNILSNFKLEQDAPFENVQIGSSIIKNSKLVNVSFDDLNIGSVNIEHLYISSIPHQGSFPIAGERGEIVAGNALHEGNDLLSVKKKIRFHDNIDFNGKEMDNVLIKSGEINSDKFDVHVRDVNAKSLTLDTYKMAKSYLRDTFIVLKENGSLSSSNITFEDGWVGDMKVFGIMDFRGKRLDNEGEESRIPGKVFGASIESGTIKGIKEFSVSGPAFLEQNLDVRGDAYVDGGLTVGGSVLGSGPYVDVSDKRLKKNIRRLRSFSNDIMDQLSRLHAVEYELYNLTTATKNSQSNLQIGFIAQEVQEVFPDLVSVRDDGYLGLQYSRFVPLLVEGMKSLQEQINFLSQQIEGARAK